MYTLPTLFRRDRTTYAQLCRHGDLALYAVQPDTALGCTYEVVRLREEAYPHDAPYGGLRWPCVDRKEGEAFLAMVLRQAWHMQEVSHATAGARRRKIMAYIDIGDVTLMEQGELLCVSLPEEQDSTTLSLQSVRVLVEHLQAWVAEQEARLQGGTHSRIGWMGTSGTDMEEHDY